MALHVRPQNRIHRARYEAALIAQVRILRL